MKANSCESCLMPLDQDTGVSGSSRYCSYCFKDGDLTYKGNDVKEFQRMTYLNMRAKGMNAIKAKVLTYMIRFAPRWKQAA